MTRDDIIRIAREAGFTNVRGGLMDNGELSDYWDCWPNQLERFANLVAAAEREECAKVCDDKAKETFSGQCQVWGDYFARAIRARGQHE